MVYESDFYTTRRPYSRPSTLSSYSVTRPEIPWDKIPFVPRPALIADPITAFGKRKPQKPKEKSVLSPIDRANIKPNQEILNRPIAPYVSPRDATRERILSQVRHYDASIAQGGIAAITTAKDDMDVLLPRLHRNRLDTFHVPHRRVITSAPFRYY